MMIRRFLLLGTLAFLCSMSFAQTLHVLANKKGKVGYADEQGNIVVPCKYEVVFPFRNGVGKVGKGEKFGLVDAAGKIILPLKYDEVSEWSETVYRIKLGKKYGLVSTSGKVLIKPKYTYISRLNCYGKAWVASGGKLKKGVIEKAKWGVVTSEGVMMAEAKYTKLCEFVDRSGRPNTAAESKRKLMDTLVTECRYISCFNGTKNIVIDETGKILAPAVNKRIYSIPSSGMCAFALDKIKRTTTGYWDINNKKELLISKNSLYSEAYSCMPFTGNIALVSHVRSHDIYFVDKEGNKVSANFEKALYGGKADGGLGYWIAYTKNKRCMLIDCNANVIFPEWKYKDLKFPDFKSEELLFPAKPNDKWGVVNEQGKTIVAFDYQEMESPDSGWIYAKKDGKYGILDCTGNVIVPFEFANIFKNNVNRSNNIWVSKAEGPVLYYNYDIEKKCIVGEGVKAAANFVDGLAWVIPQNQVVKENSILRGLRMVYRVRWDADLSTTFGIIIDKNGCAKTQIPVPNGAFSVLSKAIKENNGILTHSQERQLLFALTRGVRTYKLSSIIAADEWDY